MMPTFSLATLGVEPQNAGLASALITTAQQLGGGIGAALLNAVATSLGALPSTPGEAASGEGYPLAAATGAALLASAALCASRLGTSGISRVGASQAREHSAR